MPYSFTQIEKDKTRTIGFVFSFLIAIYFLTIWLAVLLAKNYFQAESIDYEYQGFVPLSLSETLMILAIASVVAIGHWLLTQENLIPRLLKLLKAESLNPRDTYHQMFQNIIEEVSVATGGKKMEGVIVPTMVMNAFALADFEGRAVIGITEGLLARLNRRQIEAVVGHEAGHIVSGDCLSTTVTTSLFGLYNGVLNGMTKVLRGEHRVSSRGGGGSFIVFLWLVYALLSVTRLMGLLLKMFISRQREFRADAAAVRLTRDPLSLAEALYAIAYHWRGAGLSSEELEAIFIVNPQFSSLDEQGGLFPDLFSTHSPVEKRLGVLLDMAKADIQTLERSLRNQQKPKETIPEIHGDQGRHPVNEWMIYRDGTWLGPFLLDKIVTLDWLSPTTWVKKKEGNVMPAYEDREIQGIFRTRQGISSVTLDLCPRCRISLSEVYYEGLPVLKCPTCSGVLVPENDVQRIIIREDMGFPERIERVARLIHEGQKAFGQKTKIDLETANLLKCPRCTQYPTRMIHMFYSLIYPIEIDKCIFCGFIWFDRDELEVLQCLVEGARFPEIGREIEK